MKKMLESWLQSVRESRWTLVALSVLSVALAALFVMSSAACSVKTSQAVNPVSTGVPQLKVLGLNINPNDATQGQPINISIDILNSSGIDGNYQADLVINNTTESSQVVKIPAGNIETINYKVTKSVPGDYRVSFGNLSSTFSIGNGAGQPGGNVQAITTSGTATGTAADSVVTTASCCTPTATGSAPTGGTASCCGGGATPTASQNKSATSAWGAAPSGGCCGK